MLQHNDVLIDCLRDFNYNDKTMCALWFDFFYYDLYCND